MAVIPVAFVIRQCLYGQRSDGWCQDQTHATQLIPTADGQRCPKSDNSQGYRLLLTITRPAMWRPRKALAAMRADGLLFLFDRETGEPLIPIEERPVPQDARLRTAATQPFPVGAERIIPDCAFWRDKVPPPFEPSCSFFTPPSVDQQTVVALGAPIPMVRVTPMSFSPQTGYIYA